MYKEETELCRRVLQQRGLWRLSVRLIIMTVFKTHPSDSMLKQKVAHSESGSAADPLLIKEVASSISTQQ